jgi:hypothetical protein
MRNEDVSFSVASAKAMRKEPQGADPRIDRTAFSMSNGALSAAFGGEFFATMAAVG